MATDGEFMGQRPASEMNTRTSIAAKVICALYQSKEFNQYRRDVLIEQAVEIADELLERLAE